MITQHEQAMRAQVQVQEQEQARARAQAQARVLVGEAKVSVLGKFACLAVLRDLRRYVMLPITAAGFVNVGRKLCATTYELRAWCSALLLLLAWRHRCYVHVASAADVLALLAPALLHLMLTSQK